MAECKAATAPDKISFVVRKGYRLFAEYGMVKVYANKKQADKKVSDLRSLGYAVERSLEHPYVIMAVD